MRKKSSNKIVDEVIKNREGETIANREIVCDIVSCGNILQCVTREIIKLYDGRIVIDQVLYRSELNEASDVQCVNLLTGLCETYKGE